MLDISEKDFETTIEDGLLAQGYLKRSQNDFDRVNTLITRDFFDFVYATQPKEWKKLQNICGNEAKNRLLDRLTSELKKHGTLAVLRKEIKTDGCKFKLAYFRPVCLLNEELENLYMANTFSILRQLHYSNKTEHSLDLAIFLNGIPLFTAELKDQLTGQNVVHAVNQYRDTRDPREEIFTFGRCLAHFAIDSETVYVTTHLEGKKTTFLPFNQGRNGGAGNPPSWKNFATSYLWEEIWSKNSILDLIQHFIHEVTEEKEDESGRKRIKRSLIFPRYHQLDCVRRLVHEAKEKGTGQRYLIQHSAGSGKSNSIAWLAHQLSVLHDAEDLRVFDSIIVITDRRVLDRQLQDTMLQFEQVPGIVENIDKTSKQLKQALEEGKTIIVSTLQKFPVIADEIGDLPGHRFAVIIDEAHSSQTGENTKSLKTVLADDEEEKQPKTDEEIIIENMQKRKQPGNVTYFAFTATPKNKTLELFGTKQKDGSFKAFSVYSMRQAIEEGFILDVLKNYTTYKTYWKLLKKIKDDPRYERTKANRLLKAFVDKHEITISRKIKIMVDHFVDKVMYRVNGKAKTMIVTRSRLHAVRYKLAVDRYIKEQGYNFKTLVAFSGTIQDGGIDYTEASMNRKPEKQTAETFKGDDYRIMIVAYKFQTGFDQPLLHTMYVDQRLEGVHAVQTLSRLNRIYTDKEEVIVLDFVNDEKTIQESFQPYYDRTILTEATDPNQLYDLESRLVSFHFYTDEDIERFASIFFNPRGSQYKLYSALQPVIDRCLDSEENKRDKFRKTLVDYVRLYAFLSQILPFDDTDLEKLYEFSKLLLRMIKSTKEKLPEEIQQQIVLDSIRPQKKKSGPIELQKGNGELEPIKAKGDYEKPPDEENPLSAIIKELNDTFGTDFTEDDKVFIEQLESRLDRDESLSAALRVNPKENTRLAFDIVARDKLQGMIDTNFEFYRQVNDNEELASLLLDYLFERYYNRIIGQASK